MPLNTAAWLTVLKAQYLEIKPAPYTTPLETEIVVHNYAVAFNPADSGLQDSKVDLGLEYPGILGSDLSGIVAEVGSSVTRFQPGDRVLGFGLQVLSSRKSGKSCESAFQDYTVVSASLASKIPDKLSFEDAAVLPLGLATAASGLFFKGQLELAYPSMSPERIGKVVVIWGGASSVGSNAIQLAVAAGYDVITTASPKNFDFVKKLGATSAFDYHDTQKAVEGIVEALQGKATVGALEAIGLDSAVDACANILLRSEGRRLVACSRSPPENLPEGIHATWILSSAIKDGEVSKAIFEDFLPRALEKGKYLAAPAARVVGKGLDCAQKGLDAQKKGVSAEKLVVVLRD
ncbi:MAG: hypothetical protein Q9190_001051 [Brigantiaea leucoxantha]